MKLPAGTIIGPYESRTEWLEARRSGLGGSDIGALLGLSTFSSELEVYYSKVGEYEPEVTEAMEIGRDIESWILDRWFKLYGNPGHMLFDDLVVVQSDDHLSLLHSPDAIILADTIPIPTPVIGVEVKNIRSDHNWDPLPEFYMAQVQHGLLCSGLERWIVVALVGGQKLITREIEPDLEMQGRIVEAAERFWTTHVLSKVPPEPDGSESAKSALERRWDVSEGSYDLEPELWATYKVKKTVLEAAEKDLHKAQQRIQAAMGESEVALVDGRKVATWKVGTRKSVDIKRLRDEEPKLAEKYEKVSSTRIFRPS